jgi:hypothetical protein
LSIPYKYHLRPAYDSSELLLQFNLDSSATEFIKDLFKALERIEPTVNSLQELWMNGEILLHINSNIGDFCLSRDIWDFAFVTAEENQSCIIAINKILYQSQLFIKEEVDFENYKTQKI